MKTPDQLSASDIVNRPTASTEVPDRPVLRDRSTETKQSTTRSSVAPRDIERGGSPYSTGEPTSGGTDSGNGAAPQPAPEPAPQPAQEPVNEQPAPQPAPTPTAIQPAPPQSGTQPEKPSVETIYQTPDR